MKTIEDRLLEVPCRFFTGNSRCGADYRPGLQEGREIAVLCVSVESSNYHRSSGWFLGRSVADSEYGNY